MHSMDLCPLPAAPLRELPKKKASTGIMHFQPEEKQQQKRITRI